MPDGLQAHIYRVRDVAQELAARHGIDPDRAELGALAHDVCRAIPGEDLLKMSADLGVPVTDLDRDFPILLHGPVGAELLRAFFHPILFFVTLHPSAAKFLDRRT